ncbi:MAG: hypothetical protein KDC57_06645 [Saprospiraceae bacterium]|nr:hypothetical protein [Saprospiraceae bacterium]
MNAQTNYELNLWKLLPEYPQHKIDKNINGFWEFEKLISKEGEKLDSLLTIFPDQYGNLVDSMYFEVNMANYCFEPGNKVSIYFNGSMTGYGVWSIDKQTNEMNVNEYIDVYRGESDAIQLFINYLDQDTLIFIELLPDYDDMERLNYAKAYYRKVKEKCSR